MALSIFEWLIVIINLFYLFNPDQDLTLTSGETSYMAPASAHKMVEELALLPIWFTDGECSVLAPSAYNQPFLGGMLRPFPPPVSLRTQAEDFSDVRSVIPWEWDPTFRGRLLSLGISDVVLSSMGEMERLRNFSHRSQAVKLLSHLQADERFCGESFYLTTLSDCRIFIEGRECCLFRAPLSGNSKGLDWCKEKFTPLIEHWCTWVINRERGAVGEPVCNKAEDFATEFYSDGTGKVRFTGYSLFHTNAGGAYEGNCLLSGAEIGQRLSAYVPVDALLRIQRELEKELSASLGNRCAGYLGASMMICRSGVLPTFRIHPYMEINLRVNMGLVSHLIYGRYVRSGVSRVFRVPYYSSDGQALQEYSAMKAGHPLHTEGGRVVKGYLPLVLVLKTSRYRAYILVEN